MLFADFWRFVLESPAAKQRPLRERVDSEGSTVFHHLVRAQCLSTCRRLMQDPAFFSDRRWKDVSSQLTEVLGRTNREGNTFLHVAAKHGGLQELIQLVLEKAYTLEHGGRLITVFRKKNKEGQTFMAVAMNTDVSERQMIAVMDTLMMSVHGREVFEFCCTSLDSGGNTLLHLATEGGRFDTISYLADKPIDEKHLNHEGFSPMHIAVDDNNFSLFKHILSNFAQRLDVNELTGDNETSLHLASKKGFVDMVENIVKLGGDLSSQDEHGHTPLHDLLQQVYLEGGSRGTEHCEKFRAIWGKIVEVAAPWWCHHWNIPLPDRHSQAYCDVRRDALYYLRSCIENVKGLSVVQYAAELGMVDCVDVMLTQEDVFVIRSEKSVAEYEIEVTNLCPEYKVEIQYDEKLYQGVAANISKGRTTSLVETLAYVEPPLKASAMLQGIPMMRLTTWQWKVYQVFSIVWLIFHCVIMAIASVNAEQELKSYTPREHENSTETHAPSTRHGAFDFFVMIYASLMFICTAVGPTVRAALRLWYRVCRRKAKSRGPKYEHKLYVEDTEDKGVLSYLTIIFESLSEQIQLILSLIFTVTSVCLFATIAGKSLDQFTYAWLRGAYLLFGWFIILIPARTYSPIYNFISTLKVIFLKDMIAFLLFFLIITIAFACAMQLQFQLLLNDAALRGLHPSGFQSLLNTMRRVSYELFVMTVGMDTDLKHVQDVSDLFQQEAANSYIIRTLLIAYGVVSVLILLNMLIAMMGTTLTVVIETEGTGWRQYQVGCRPILHLL